ncbi:MAG: rod shape-determining protein RodA [Candidatus Omnitrophica bacterium]|nr:rod shape-determining protein RodA [Candidatus Omnitrophota bacterium]
MNRMFDQRFDRFLLAAPVLIFLIGIFTLYSASFKSGESEMALVMKQVLWMGVGVLLVFLVIRVPYLRFRDMVWPFYGLSLLLLVLVLFAPARMGAHRWIQAGGFNFQPSEIAKLSVIFALAHFFAQNRYERTSTVKKLVPFILAGAPFLLILKEPDLGTALLLAPVLFSMLYLWGFKARRILVMLGMVLAVSPFLFAFLKDYQKARLLVFVNPNLDPAGAGYTVIQSKIAIGSGGWWGKGFMGGTQNQLQFLPERHTDFIFAVIAEEGGFLAASALLFLFGVIVKKGGALCGRTSDAFGSQIACGITVMIGTQVLVNMAMTMGLLPVVGIPLPLVSYGGSSVVMTMLSVAFLLNIKIHKPLF